MAKTHFQPPSMETVLTLEYLPRQNDTVIAAATALVVLTTPNPSEKLQKHWVDWQSYLSGAYGKPWTGELERAILDRLNELTIEERRRWLRQARTIAPGAAAMT